MRDRVPCRTGGLLRLITRWDVHVFARAGLVAILALALSWLLTAATDEGGVAWGERVGRTLPLTPLCSAIGVWATIAPVKARGEARALEALGRTKAQVAAPAVAAGACIALVAALSLGLLPSVSVAGFYPTAPHSTAWHWDGTAFIDPVRRLRVGDDGTPVRLSAAESRAPRGQIPGGRTAAALATAMTGIALALLLADALLATNGLPSGAERASDGRYRWLRSASTSAIAATGTCAATALVLFQAAAARKVPALVGDLPPLALLLLAARRVWTER